MKKNSPEFYAYVLSLCCVMTGILAVVVLTATFYSVVRWATPEVTLSSAQFDKFQTNESFWDACRLDRLCSDEDEEVPTDEVLTDLRKEWFERALQVEQHEGKQQLIWMLAALFMLVLIAGVHAILWRLMKKGDEPPAETAEAKSAKA
ncbi:MAG: hypothetical protein EPO06_10015 [Burkholderiaceae bacterium]|nr:MAG: hypothetical protein EPO06_10015 [Burkholderiaceae bacterium]